MARSAEYYHDPRAPKANSLRPTAFAAVLDDDGRLLLVRRADTRNWELPGGKIELGESSVDAVVREVREESGIRINVNGLSGVYTDPAHIMVYATGEVRQQFALCFHARPLSGRPRPDHNETIDAAWYRRDELPQLTIHPSITLRIEHALKHPHTVQFV